MGYGLSTSARAQRQPAYVVTPSALARASLRICITGATGFVGGHAARLLAEHGHGLRAADGLGLLAGVGLLERYAGRRLLVRP